MHGKGTEFMMSMSVVKSMIMLIFMQKLSLIFPVSKTIQHIVIDNQANYA